MEHKKPPPPKQRRTFEQVKERATSLYHVWGEAKLKKTIDMIEQLRDKVEENGEWSEYDHNMAIHIQDIIVGLHNTTVKHISEIKKISESEVKTRPLQFPSGLSEDDLKRWCSYATRAAYETESFHSHVMRKNPNPKDTKRWNKKLYEADKREKRSSIEQEWLQEQDHLHRMEKRRASRKLKKKNTKTKGGKSHKAEGRKSTPKQHSPESAIVPYERPASRAAPKTASRLPAFPKFPSYARK